MNNKIKSISHRSFGFRTAENFTAAIYHCCRPPAVARRTLVALLGQEPEKRMISALVCSVATSLDYWPVY
jgi:hypothetical protein